MRILVSWLREFVDVPVTPDALATMLSMRGFEVAAIEELAPPAPVPGPADASPDAVIDLEITPNRPDCLGVLGIAREVATAYDLPLRVPAAGAGLPAPPRGAVALQVTIEDAELCPRYAAAVAEVAVAPSPAWLAFRLQAAGIRPINNVVDVTNYVMVECGHPMHAFDFDRLAGGELRIRRARPNERIRTIDGEDRSLTDEMLMIADAHGPQAIAGVMGSAGSEVHDGTSLIALESAYFQPASVRRTSRRLGLTSEASARFERGADINAPLAALARACALLQQIGAGRAIGHVLDRYPSPRRPAHVALRRERIRRVLGQAVEDAVVLRICRGLGFSAAPLADGWDFTVPTWRVDIGREVDLIEEIARHDGYDRLPTTFPALSQLPPPLDPHIDRDRLVRRIMTAAGFSEVMTFAFIEASAAASFVEDPDATVPLANPLSEKFAVLRPSLLSGLVDSVAHNRRRERRDVRLFELGTRFSASGGERRGLALAWTGAAWWAHWSGGARDVDFFDVKGAVERLCHLLEVPVEFESTALPAFLVAGRAARVRTIEGPAVGVLGQLAPPVLERRGLPPGDEVYVAEIDLDALAAFAPKATGTRVDPLPRYPSIVRDLSIIVDETLPAAAVRGTIHRAAPETLAEVREFDRYQGQGVPEGRVSLSFRLTFRASDRTLTDAEAQRAMEAIVAAVVQAHRAVQR